MRTNSFFVHQALTHHHKGQDERNDVGHKSAHAKNVCSQSSNVESVCAWRLLGARKGRWRGVSLTNQRKHSSSHFPSPEYVVLSLPT